MVRFLLAFTTAASLLVIGPLAQGQAPTDQRPPGQQAPEPTAKLKLSMEQEHVIKELVREDKTAKDEAGQTPETVGASVPSTVMLRPMPEDIGAKVPQVKSHRYFKKGERVFIVDPKDNEIVDVID